MTGFEDIEGDFFVVEEEGFVMHHITEMRVRPLDSVAFDMKKLTARLSCMSSEDPCHP